MQNSIQITIYVSENLCNKIILSIFAPALQK